MNKVRSHQARYLVSVAAALGLAASACSDAALDDSDESAGDSVGAPLATSFHDDFSSSALSSGWSFTDPVGNSSYSLTADQGHLQMKVPSGSTHDCWSTSPSCIRMMRTVGAGDQTFTTKIDGVNVGGANQSYGILLQQDASNYLRFEFWSNGTGTYVNAYKVIANTGSQAIAGPKITMGSANLLRVVVSGNTFTLKYSVDGGSTWATAGSFTQSFTLTNAGLEVGNCCGTTSPAATANFDYFDDAPSTASKSAPFQRIVIDQSPGVPTLEKAFADLNGDGKLDFILGHGNNGGIYWYQFPSTGNPADPWPKHTISTAGTCYEHMQILDMNKDGRPDIVLSVNSNVEWLQNPGSTTGSWTWHFIASGIGHELRLADMDGDGHIDVVTSRTRNIDFQNGPTSWTIVPYGASVSGTKADGLAMLDIGSGRGAIDMVIATSTGIYWLENPREHGGNARTGSYVAHWIGQNYGSNSGPALAAADVNGDGRMDVISAPNENTQGTMGLVWWAAPVDRRNGTWTRHTIDTTYQDVHWIEVADMNLDGHRDLVVTEEEQSHDPSGGPYSFTNDRVAVLYNDGAGNFTSQVLEWTGGQNQVVADIDKDGDLDFATVNHGVYGAPNPVELFLNKLH